MVPEIPNRKLQPRRRVSSWKICRARRRPTNPGGNPIVAVEELIEKLGFDHLSTFSSIEKTALFMGRPKIDFYNFFLMHL